MSTRSGRSDDNSPTTSHYQYSKVATTTTASTMQSSPQQPHEYGATVEEPPLSSPYHLQENNNALDGTPQHDHPHPHGDNGDDDLPDEYEMSLTELLYSSSSYHAIVKPVTLTMTLAALSVIFVNDDETIQQGEAELATAYQTFKTDGADGETEKLGLSLANSLIMVSVLAAMTFCIVFLYKFRFMKCLIGYMMLSSGTLLGVLGGNLWYTAIEIYRLPVDKFTFWLAVYNFCVVGVISIFWARTGVPTYITQAYLVATSVILAWQLAHFDDWTAWCLLFMLAIYDLCAVLTPCGPLKVLVHLMSQEDSPDMPGLLYEAELPPEAQRPGVPRTARSDVLHPSASNNTNKNNNTNSTIENAVSMPDDAIVDDRSELTPDETMQDSMVVEIDIPLAMAHVYNLPIVRGNEAVTDAQQNPTVAQLRSMVTVRLPLEGGRLERVVNTRRLAYLERDRFGDAKRTVWVDKQGKVFAEVIDDEDAESNQRGNTIRLGLGDFIFYSILVAKAAQYSFATFAACMLVILAGLGGTLVLLSVYHHALPALPISIFMGIFCYLVTRLLIEPWIEAILRLPYYV